MNSVCESPIAISLIICYLIERKTGTGCVSVPVFYNFASQSEHIYLLLNRFCYAAISNILLSGRTSLLRLPAYPASLVRRTAIDRYEKAHRQKRGGTFFLRSPQHYIERLTIYGKTSIMVAYTFILIKKESEYGTCICQAE